MINLDKSKKYSIVGVPKCGTSSMGEYMRKFGFDVTEDELYFMDKENYPHKDRIPIIILRDPIERAWSDFNFFKDFHDTIQKACKWSRYYEGIKLWNNPIIFHLEELQKIPEFPHYNENIYKQPLIESIRNEIIMELKH